MKHRVFITAVVLSWATAVTASVTVTAPEADAILLTGSTIIQGVSTDTGVMKVSVTRGTSRRSAAVDPANGTWATDFPLTPGINKIVIQADPPSPGSIPAVLFVTRGEGIERRPKQHVLFVWDDDTDNELEAIARGTLDAPLTTEQVKAFIDSIRTQVPLVFTRAYRGIADIDLVTQDGDDVHTVHLLGVDSGFFGLSPGDCGNRELKQESSVFVGTYRQQIVGSFSDWAPMQKSDSPADRARDVAEALGRTAAHETGHSLGLVADDGPCNWMSGCDGFHSCFVLQQIHNGLSRFGGGFFIMDPGPRSANQARIAEATKSARSSPRRPATFSMFDQHYLAVIHPVPLP